MLAQVVKRVTLASQAIILLQIPLDVLVYARKNITLIKALNSACLAPIPIAWNVKKT